MVDHIVDASAPRGRVEIRSGVGRRRRWNNADKGRIVAESFAPGAVVSEVARRHDISPQHLFAWRKAARRGQLALPADDAAVFVPVMMAAQKPVATTPSITIETAGIVVQGSGRMRRGCPSETLHGSYLRFPCCCVFRKRTPGPPPFSDMN